ncbi:MAG: hypothetical protein JWL77_2843 [Chthonomonadaceae bacterium]|nr:hypothetical protein [Chthonomonadaceae bacterium]
MQYGNHRGIWKSLLLAGILCMAAPHAARAQGNPDQHSSGAFSTVIFDDATGEAVDIDVTVKSGFHVVVDNGGNFHLDAHDVFSGRGVGEITGTQYIANQVDTFSMTLTKGGGTETAPIHFSMISKGGADNLEVYGILHITVNANGTVTSSVNNFTVVSRGK